MTTIFRCCCKTLLSVRSGKACICKVCKTKWTMDTSKTDLHKARILRTDYFDRTREIVGDEA